MKQIFLIVLLALVSSLGFSQFYSKAQITTINSAKTAFEGDLYLDTINKAYFIGLTDGSLSEIGMDSTRVSNIFYDLLDTINGSVFPVFAEESGPLDVNAFEWAYGNGDDSPADFGIVLPMNCELFAIGLNVRTGSGTVEVYKNGVATGLNSGSASPVSLNSSFTALSFKAGDVVNFRTIAQSGASEGGKVVAWLRVPSTDLPTKKLYGGTVPANTLGESGDEYMNTSNGDLYSKSGGVWTFQTNLRGITGASSLRSYIQVTNTVSDNINNGTTTFDWLDTIVINAISNDLPTFSMDTNGITINKTATYKVTIYQYQVSVVQRSNSSVRITKNGIIEDGFGANAYVRRVSGHDESTASISKLISITAGDKLGFVNVQQALVGSVTCPANSLIFMIEEM